MSCVLRPTRYIATRIDNAPNGLSKRKQNACVHCIHETNEQDVGCGAELFQERCKTRTAVVVFCRAGMRQMKRSAL